MERFYSAAADAIKIVDTTLRDGEQTAGVVFSNQEKLDIAKMLDEIGVHQIEAGIPEMGGGEQSSIEKMAHMGLQASVLGWCRAVRGSVDAAVACGVDAVAISISTSDIHIEHKLGKTREWVIEAMTGNAVHAKEQGIRHVSVNAEDASRSDMDYLVQFGLAAKAAGADRLRYCDTVGIMEPFTIYENVKQLIERTGLPVEMHTHNDFGLATANALCGIRAGATFVNTTVNGLGERAGNAALEEVAMALRHLHKLEMPVNTVKLRRLSELVAKASARDIPIWKAIVGANVFAAESGIHADGILKNPMTYEAFSPEEVGLQRQILIGKHSGSAAIKNKFSEYGIALSDDVAALVLERIRQWAVERKRTLFDKELMQIYEDVIGARRDQERASD
ncbi:MAG: homocitrate synthase [Armatimonadota bacterium]|nr:MAG: homocitrate synthase [Armatimonadota bacterium]